MSDWNTICRVCSSPANYNIFAKIPTYLHESSNEFINWQKPINIILEQTTGMKVTEDDGLPKSICAICISYMKHACTFRKQFIQNSLSLQVVKKVRDTKLEDKASLLITEQELQESEKRKIDTNVLHQNGHDKVTKELFNASLEIRPPTTEYITQQMRYLNLLFDKDPNSGISEMRRQTSNGSDNAANNRNPSEGEPEVCEAEATSNEETDEENGKNATLRKENILSYCEKNFEEDDVMNMDELQDIINITIPETCKERKCRACFRRYMFEDSYNEHLEKCIEYKFLLFIEETNLLLEIRRQKAVSPHEFIRRIIFSLRKICDFLKANCDELLPLPDYPVASNESESGSKNGNFDKDSSYDLTSLLDKADIGEMKRVDDDFNTLNRCREELNETNDPGDLNLAQHILTMNSPTFTESCATPPISVHNNILYEIERSQSRNTNPPNVTNIDAEHSVKVMRPIPMHATVQSHSNAATSPLQRTPSASSAEERLTFLQKLERAVSQTPQSMQTPTPINTPSISVRKDLMPNNGALAGSSSLSCFSACCNQCNLVFDTLCAFEIHNAIYHNSNIGIAEPDPEIEVAEEAQPDHSDSDEEQKRIIDMFENEDDFYDDN